MTEQWEIPEILTDPARRWSVEDDFEEETSCYEVFNEIYAMHNYERDGDREIGTTDCGSVRFSDPAKAMYRLIVLSEPGMVDFSDTYKSEAMFALRSPCWQFVAEFQFFKGEFACYFSCPTAHLPKIQQGKYKVTCGIPGHKEPFCTSEKGMAWMSTLTDILNSPVLVYSGNNFWV